MRKLLTILCLMATCPLYSQSIKKLEPAVLECQYNLEMVKDTVSRNLVTSDIMILRIGKNTSQFFSRYTYQGDSILASPNGAQEFGNLFMNGVASGNTSNLPCAKTTKDYIYKNYPKGQITTFTNDGLLSDFVYNEKYEPQSWAMLDSTKQILGYSCQLATCSFRGRIFLAWFTADIPISDGPWKLSGLPGLILEAYDKDKHYHYTIAGIKQQELQPVTLYKYASNGYEKIDRIAYLKKQRKLLDSTNPIADMEAATGVSIKPINAAPTPIKRKTYDFIERDYR